MVRKLLFSLPSAPACPTLSFVQILCFPEGQACLLVWTHHDTQVNLLP